MAEENGNRDSRLDRIERALELLISDHEQFRFDHKQLLTAQVLQKDAIDQLLKTTQEHSKQIAENSKQIAENSKQIAEHSKQIAEHSKQIAGLDERVDKLVSAIGRLVADRPS